MPEKPLNKAEVLKRVNWLYKICRCLRRTPVRAERRLKSGEKLREATTSLLAALFKRQEGKDEKEKERERQEYEKAFLAALKLTRSFSDIGRLKAWEPESPEIGQQIIEQIAIVLKAELAKEKAKKRK